ncbi:poly A polymerase C-terminal region-like protein [Punctularia strigosozonata HHB-11173 SS5]|uniref:poly A polymerase C-terminal region-like protein n=1 Tax=Punctularia strigosozonata (strain HHB-11173) TaxID=741275 RepID=UPI0004417D4E|nr:poly A polymerase C-terminal region-like protein [Punctularia strigosozonata HHB-11173 SS5]EIN13478.1 poly A polymerase C-terminal region-like protein [Punctularia strigosozonata HHB-11173 SS5]
MGVPFAEKLLTFLAEEKGMDDIKLSIVKSNPGQSKHLETAKVNPILGFELDLVNLRSEEYAIDSRIPTEVTFGTPLQDALRRDITINSLFYNVHSKSVEDHTGKGLHDLRNGVVRTPLPPRETFLDDPLRVLRCVRFASRFGFDMVPELVASAKDPEIQTAFRSKITRERVGEEVHKMMKGRHPLLSIQLMDELSLPPLIFDVPASISSTFSSQPAPYHTALAASSVLHLIIDAPTEPSSSVSLPPVHSELLSGIRTDSTAQSRLYLACAVTPYRGITFTDAKKRIHPACEAALREGLRVGTQNHYLDGIPALFGAWEILRGPVGGDQATQDSNNERARIGLLLREKTVHNPHTGSHWATSLLFSLVQDLVELYNPIQDLLDVAEASKVIAKYNDFVARILELDLPSAVEAKPILDGHEIVQILEAGKPGSWTGGVLARVTEWQLEFPQGTKEECAQWLTAEKKAGRIDVQTAGGSGGGRAGKEGKRAKGERDGAVKKPKVD